MPKTNFIPSTTQPPSLTTPAYWFIFNGFGLLVYDLDAQAQLPKWQAPDSTKLPLIHSQYLGCLKEGDQHIHCFCGEVAAETVAPEGMAFLGLRRLFTRIDDTLLSLAGRAVQIVDWDRTHQFCGRCGVPVEQLSHERAKKCPQCGLTTYPRISPAIIVSIERPLPDNNGTQLLLAHNNRHPFGFYSVLAGFVEPGESLEDCVRREIMEEVSLEIKNLCYFGSQSWPFPNSLMVAFTCEYAAGKIQLEEDELDDANWFSADNLPMVPPPASIARQLIDAFVMRNQIVQS